jgi:tol-pal system protein YbgF
MRPAEPKELLMSLSRVAIVFFALSPFAFGASKEIMELQRDVALLQDQVRNLQTTLDQKVAAIEALTGKTLDSVDRTNASLAVMQNTFNDTMKQQQLQLNGPVANVGQKLGQMSEDFNAVREAVLDMNTRMSKLQAKIADLENLLNTVRAPAAPPPSNGTVPPGDPNSGLAPGGSFAPTNGGNGPPQGLQAGTLYTSAYSDQLAGKYDIAFQEFGEYLKYFSNTELAPNAQYYIADIYYRKADYANALTAFDAVLEKFPDNPKTPDAHYMKGMCLVKLGRNDSAAREFRDVYARYAESHPDIAAKAKAQLRDMGLRVGITPKRRSASN